MIINMNIISKIHWLQCRLKGVLSRAKRVYATTEEHKWDRLIALKVKRELGDMLQTEEGKNLRSHES